MGLPEPCPQEEWLPGLRQMPALTRLPKGAVKDAGRQPEGDPLGAGPCPREPGASPSRDAGAAGFCGGRLPWASSCDLKPLLGPFPFPRGWGPGCGSQASDHSPVFLGTGPSKSQTGDTLNP